MLPYNDQSWNCDLHTSADFLFLRCLLSVFALYLFVGSFSDDLKWVYQYPQDGDCEITLTASILCDWLIALHWVHSHWGVSISVVVESTQSESKSESQTSESEFKTESSTSQVRVRVPSPYVKSYRTICMYTMWKCITVWIFNLYIIQKHSLERATWRWQKC